MQSQVSNRFTVVLGASPTTELNVAPELSAMGINVIKQSPDQVTWSATPQMRQPGYGTYKTHLGHFISAFYRGTPVNLSLPGCTIPAEVTSIPEWGLPKVAFGWGIPVANEVLDNLRETWKAYDVSGMGKAGLAVDNPNMDAIRHILSTNPTRNFPAPYGMTNLSTLAAARVSKGILYAFSKLQQYPAFLDQEHYEMFVDERHYMAGEDVNTEFQTRVAIQGRDTIDWPHDIPQHFTKLGNLASPGSVQNIIDPTSFTPPCGGIWFPYISPVANYDTKTAVSVIQTYFSSCLGDSAEEINTTIEQLRSAWGLLGRTEWGKQITHAFYVMRIAIECQCSVRLAFEGANYLGVVMLGEGYELCINNGVVSIGSAEQLGDAMRLGGSNKLILRKIANAASMRMEELDNITSMWELRHKLFEDGCPLDQQREIIRMASGLRFEGGIHWKPVVSSFTKAAEYIASPTPIEEYNKSDNLPITASSLFSLDKVAVIWSCFGEVAPSFRIPGGSVFKLARGGNTVSRNIGLGRKATKEVLNVTKVSLRMVSLELAISDIKAVIQDKEIHNPFATPQPKRSTANAYKTFSGNNMDKVVGALRLIAKVDVVEGVSLDKGKKRMFDGDGAAGPSAKRGALDLTW